MQTDQLFTIAKSIVSYAGWMFTDPQDIRIANENLVNMTLSILEKQEGIDNYIAKLLLGKELDAYIKNRKSTGKTRAPYTPLCLGNEQRTRRTVWKVKEFSKRSTRS